MQVLLCIGGLAVIVVGMYYSITYPYPNGKPLDFVGFVLFWLREIIILAFIALAIMIFITTRLIQLIRRLLVKRKMGSNNGAPDSTY